MPDDRLTQAMLSRPVSVTGDVQYPKAGDPGVVDDKAMRALGVALGIDEQQPGDAAGAIGGAMGAISLIPPGIAKLRGAKMIQMMRESGKVPEDIMQAAELAQQRWPRVFGHMTKLGPMEGDTVATAIPNAAGTKHIQSMYPTMEKANGVMSELRFNPSEIRNKDEAANAMGHELLHAADSITDPNFLEKYYRNNDLDGGYFANSHEIRARLQGERTQGYMNGAKRGELAPVTGANTYLSTSEVTPKTLDSRITSLPVKLTKPQTRGPVETDTDKILRLMAERKARQIAGNPDPRVPIKKEGY